MTYRLIALDVDGTVQNSRHELSPRNEAALKNAQAAGVAVVLATGKQYVAIRRLIEQIGLQSPQITSDGSIISTPAGEVIYRQGVPREPAEQFIALAHKMGVTPVIARDGQTFAVERNADVDYMLTYGDPVPTFMPDLRAALEPPPSYLMGLAYQRDVLYEDFEAAAKAQIGAALNIYRTSPYYIQAVHPAVSKGAALEKLCEMLGVGRAEVLAVGDSFNDISMFRFAGRSVAMGHSNPAVQAAAHEITATNDEDGVAHVIERYILNHPPG